MAFPYSAPSSAKSTVFRKIAALGLVPKSRREELWSDDSND